MVFCFMKNVESHDLTYGSTFHISQKLNMKVEHNEFGGSEGNRVVQPLHSIWEYLCRQCLGSVPGFIT